MKKLAIVGVTGLVGEKMLEIAEKSREQNVRVFASGKSIGKRIKYLDGFLTVEGTASLEDFAPTHALFATEADVSKQLIPPLTRRGTVCIDNSSAYRLAQNVPLVVPCVNGLLARGQKLIANPNCTTIQTVIALNALKKFGLKRVTAVSYQAVSGAGKNGLADLNNDGSEPLRAFKYPICDNVIPAIGKVKPDGYTAEEHKLMDETKKILQMPWLQVNAFCVRVPVRFCHSVFVSAELNEPFSLPEIRRAFKNSPCVTLCDNVKNDVYPMPVDFAGKTDVGVGRITRDKSQNAVNFFVVADNVLRGASYNAWEILQAVEND